jgi:probable phosphoglycerate mutase
MLSEAPAPAGLSPVPFYYLRHGETDWNRGRRIQGITDVSLNETGRAQAAAAAALLAGREIATLCVSPLARARETAEIVNRRLRRPLVVVERLHECDLGCQEGGPFGEWWHDWRAGRSTPERAEPYSRFIARALAAVNEALLHPGPVLIVGHGGVYWSVQQHGRLDADATLANARPVWHIPPTADFPGWRAEPLA